MEDPAGPSDAELVTRVLAGDEDLFGVLVDRYKLRLFRFVSRYLGDPEDARDVTQEVFFKIYSALDSYDPKYRFSTWAFRIAGNAAIDHLRRRRIRAIPLQFPADDESEGRKIDPVDGKPDPLEELSRTRLREALDLAIERLPRRLPGADQPPTLRRAPLRGDRRAEGDASRYGQEQALSSPAGPPRSFTERHRIERSGR
ncbi:MAG: sigma-70 family RNA polymerase sigma factor [Holophagales bacterium]|nr:sigma-70 family RNA polymerase sigma factor [Holophagales bacterium]